MRKLCALMLSFIMTFSSAVSVLAYDIEFLLSNDKVITQEEIIEEETIDLIDVETEFYDETNSTKSTLDNITTFSQTNNISTLSSQLTTTIVFGYVDDLETFIKDKDVKVTYFNSNNQQVGYANLSNGTTSFSNYNTNIEIIKYDNFSKVSLKVDGLDPDEYKVKVTGIGYKDFITDSIDISNYTKEVVIGTLNGTFSIGDLNQDGVIDDLDIALIEESINSATFDPKYDINNDGLINIGDIVFINNNINSNGKEVVYDLKAIISGTLNVGSNISSVSGELKNLFSAGESVTFTSNSNISTDNPINFETEFDNPVKTSEIQIVNTNISSGTVTITYEDESGEVTKQYPIGKATTFSSSRNSRTSSNDTVTISLGSAVAVKKVSVSVTAVSNDDGSNNYAVVEEIQFLKDIVPDELISNTIVTKVQVTPGDGELLLEWPVVPNVMGYKVKYGESSGSYTKELEVDTNSATISGLDNLKTYYFIVSAISGDWEGGESQEFSGTPIPKSVPGAPDGVTVKAGDSMITVSWKATSNAEKYNVYLAVGQGDFTKIEEGITNTSLVINKLTNDIEYKIKVTAVNSIGEGPSSIIVAATPEKIQIYSVEPPELNQIPVDEIKSVVLDDPNKNYDTTLYPDGFDANWVIDRDYETSWVSNHYAYPNSFTFEFENPHTMDYLIVVPRLDDPSYGNSLSHSGHYPLTITVWKEGEEDGEGTVLTRVDSVNNVKISYTKKENDEIKYIVISFPKQENVTKIRVKLSMWDGAPKNPNASEFFFYDYNDINDRILDLFVDSSLTSLKGGITSEIIDKIEGDLNEVLAESDDYIVNKDILLEEINHARALLAGDISTMGVIKDGLKSINTDIDDEKYGLHMSDLQPLGISAKALSEIVIYADIPEGEVVELVATQFFSTNDKMSLTPITLNNGRNVISVPQVSSFDYEKGGSLYVTYSGDKGDQIKLQIKGNYYDIPLLELENWYNISETERKEIIRKYINELTQYVSTLTGDLETNVLNVTEISLPNILLSMPANKILEGIEENLTEESDKIERVYNNVLAWEEVLKICYTIYGIDSESDYFKTRNNIRYMRMFDGAFMYAATNHIGVGYDSTKSLIQGVPTSVTFTENPNATVNQLFGWGISHEIGHVLDGLGKAEITNNIYSLMVQTYDGNANTLTSRLEDESYNKAYDKVSIGRVGESNDFFVQLVMYWQLHLAYDDDSNPMNFYNQVYKLYRSGTYNQFKDMDKFAVIASVVANKDLTEFFTRWGVSLSDEAKAEMAKGRDQETRKIYYLNDESRRQSINGQSGLTQATVNATSIINDSNPKQVDITITTGTNGVFGYEIIRNNSPIGFIRNNENNSVVYSDIIGSANNMAFEYDVLPIDILGNALDKVDAGKVRVEYDNTIDNSLYTSSFNNGVYIAQMKTTQTISGIIIKPKDGDITELNGNIKVEIKADNSEGAPISLTSEEGFVVAKEGPFLQTNSASNSDERYLTYFNKIGADYTDSRIWTFDASIIRITGLPVDFEDKYSIDFISYPGDNVQFDEFVSGRLKSDLVYGMDVDDVIKAGTLIVTGSYRGDPVYNTLLIQGRFDEVNSQTGELYTVERAISGYVLFFATELEEGEEYSTISDGIFIFVPDIQSEIELQHGTVSDCSHVSVLPKQIKAELYRTDDPYDTSSKRLTSDTLWVDTPSDESMPIIEIK